MRDEVHSPRTKKVKKTLHSLAPPLEMGKFGRRFMRRAIMNSKFGNKNYVKGRGGRNEGTHTNKGGYVVRPERLMTIVAPDLAGCELRPYVHRAVELRGRGERVPVFPGMVEGAEKELR